MVCVAVQFWKIPLSGSAWLVGSGTSGELIAANGHHGKYGVDVWILLIIPVNLVKG